MVLGEDTSKKNHNSDISMEKYYVVHPQVALQIADHATRSQFFSKDFVQKHKFIIGILYGFADDRKIEVCSTCESIVNETSSGYEVDKLAFDCISRHHNLNYVGEVELGWYNITPMKDNEINAVNAAFEKIFKVQLRITFMQTGEHTLVLNVPENDGKWRQTLYKYRSELAEHVAISQVQSQGNANNQISFTEDAYKALDKELEIIQDFLEKTMTGAIPFQPDLVRKCNDIALWFRHAQPDRQTEIAIEEGQLALLSGLLAEAMTVIDTRIQKTRKQPSRQSSSAI